MFAGENMLAVGVAPRQSRTINNTPEKVMFTGTDKSDSVISRVEHLYARLDKIREDSSRMSADEKREYYDHLNAITNKQTELNASLDSLKTASVSSYDGIKEEIEEHIQSLENLLRTMHQHG